MMAGYTEAQRAMAVEIVRRNDGVLSAGTLTAIRAAIEAPSLSKQLVYYWMKADSSPASESKPNAQSNPVKTPRRLPGKKRVDPERARNRQEAQSKAAEALDVILEAAARRFVDHAMNQRILQEASTREAMTAAGIAIDKMRLLRGLPTEIIGILPALIQKIEEKGLKASDVFQAMMEQLAVTVPASSEEGSQ